MTKAVSRIPTFFSRREAPFWTSVQEKFELLIKIRDVKNSTNVIEPESDIFESNHVHFQQDVVKCHTSNEIIDFYWEELLTRIFYRRVDHNWSSKS